MPQSMNCEAVGSITSATMSNDSLTASVLTDLGKAISRYLQPFSLVSLIYRRLIYTVRIAWQIQLRKRIID